MHFAFFQPLFLWALALCAVPVIVHLLFRRRVTSMLFSSLRFFRETVVRASRRRKLRRILLLIVRVLVVMAAVLIFAQPFDASSPFSILDDPRVSVYVWIDPTVSMDYRIRGLPLWRRSNALVDSLDAVLPSTAGILLYDERSDEFVRRPADEQERTVRHGPSSIERALAAFRRSSRARSLLVVVSDFQSAPTGSGRSAARAVERFAADEGRTPVCCVAMMPRDPWDRGVFSARIAPENPAMLVAGVAARGRGLSAGALTVMQGGMRVGREEVATAKNSCITVRIAVASANTEEGAGAVRLEADDPFPLDNVRYFARRPPRAFRVLIVGEPEKCLPVAAAFRSLDPATWRPVTAVDYRMVTPDDLDSADLIVLNAVPEGTLALHQFVSGRGYGDKAAIFAPAVDSQRQEFNRVVFQEVLKSGEPHLRSGGPERTVVLSDTVSALWEGFPRLTDADVRIAAYCAVAGGDALARLDNNEVFAADVSLQGAIRWIVVATELGISAGNNLCESGLYVPFLDRLGRRAVLGTSSTVEWFAGISAPNPHHGAASPAQVYDAGRRLVSRWDRQPRVVFDSPGCFQVKPEDASSYWIAANIDTSECNFSCELPVVKKSSRFKVVDEEGFAGFVRRARRGSAGKVLWMVLAALVLAEMLLWLPAYSHPSRGKSG